MKTLEGRFWEDFVSKQRSFLNRYLFALIASLVSLGLVKLLHSFEDGMPLTPFALFSVILCAIYGGKGPAMFDTLITALGVDLYFIPPINEVLDSWSSILTVIIYILSGIIVATLVDSLKINLLILKKEKERVEEEKKARESILACE